MITFAYDENGSLVERTSPNGAKRTSRYDDDNRLLEEQHFMPNQSTASKINSYSYDQRGLLLSYQDGLTSGAYVYNKKGEKTSETITFGTGATAITKTLSRSYEANGLLKTLMYPGTTGTSSFAYDTNNQLKTYKVPGLAANNDTLTYSYRWNAITEITMPGNLKRTVTLDALQRPTQIEVKGTAAAAQAIMNHRYQYDAVSNILKKTTLDGEYDYGYDALDRLTGATPPESVQSNNQNPNGLPIESYSYDGVHNRESSAHQPGPWKYNANNELSEWAQGSNKRQLTYDANGSTIKEVQGSPATETTDYVYDAQDRLIEVKKNAVSVAKYAYDPMGRRVWREAGSQITWFLYSDEGLIEELNSATNTIRTYGWNPGGLWGTDTVWQKDANGTFLTSNDHLYTTDLLTKATDGAVAWSAMRESFGKTSVRPEAATEYLMRFPGQWEDDVGGFAQNWWREYSLVIGGFRQGDLIDIDLGWKSIYVYGGAKPLTNFDYAGMFAGPSPVEFCKNPRNWKWCVDAEILPKRPDPSPKPAPSSGPKPQSPTGAPEVKKDDCDSCSTHPVLSLLPECEELSLVYTSLKQAMIFEFPDGKEYGKRPTTKGDCPGLGSHWNVRQVSGGPNIGSVFSCPCCEDTGGGPVPRERFSTTRTLR
jgi:RHS repeat-associated protein